MSKWRRLGLAVGAVTAITYGVVLAVETNSAEPATTATAISDEPSRMM